MVIVRRLMIWTLAAAFALTGLSAAAQDADGTPAADDEFEGIVAAVQRDWTYDWVPVYMATPDAMFDGPAHVTGIYEMSALVYEFDSADHATSAYTEVKGLLVEFVTGMQAEAGEATPDIAAEDMTGVGDVAYVVDAHTPTQTYDGYSRIAMVQAGTLLFVVDASSTTAEGLDTVNALLDYMTTEGQKGGDVDFADDGTSTGGLWDVLPPAGHASLNGLIPSRDADV